MTGIVLCLWIMNGMFVAGMVWDDSGGGSIGDRIVLYGLSLIFWPVLLYGAATGWEERPEWKKRP